MARPYDNGTRSAAKQEAFLAMVRERLVALNPSADPEKNPEPGLPELMADFYGAVSKNRKKEEIDRVLETERIPAEDGSPRKVPHLSFLKVAIPMSFRTIWEDMFDRENRQAEKADAVAAYIDRRIQESGGSVAGIRKAAADHERLRSLDRSIRELEEALAYIPFAVGINNLTPMGTAGRLANSGNAKSAIQKAVHWQEKVTASLEDFPDFDDSFPEMKIAHVGLVQLMASPFASGPGEAREASREMLEGLREFRQKFDSWDVMSAYHGTWEKRAAACQALGLNEEADACNKVAAEYDVTYFEALDKAWKAEKTWGLPRKSEEQAATPSPT